MNKPTNVIFLLVLFLSALSSCKTLTTSNGEKIKPFKGTIIYDVQVVQVVDTSYVGDKKYFFGDQMHLTVFRNGDIQRKYFNSSRLGYDLDYMDIKHNIYISKYNNSDSFYQENAKIANMAKVRDLPLSKESEKILSYDLKEIAIGAQETATSLAKGSFLGLRYWHSGILKVDKSRYNEINHDLWSYFMNKSDGSLCLKYEIDYLTYKVTYTAIGILPGKFEKHKEISDESLRVIR